MTSNTSIIKIITLRKRIHKCFTSIDSFNYYLRIIISVSHINVSSFLFVLCLSSIGQYIYIYFFRSVILCIIRRSLKIYLFCSSIYRSALIVFFPFCCSIYRLEVNVYIFFSFVLLFSVSSDASLKIYLFCSSIYRSAFIVFFPFCRSIYRLEVNVYIYIFFLSFCYSQYHPMVDKNLSVLFFHLSLSGHHIFFSFCRSIYRIALHIYITSVLLFSVSSDAR